MVPHSTIATLSQELSWSRFRGSLPSDGPFQRDFYIEMCWLYRWSVRTLLLNGSEQSLLVDTGLKIYNSYDEAIKLTDNPIIAVAMHIHWNHGSSLSGYSPGNSDKDARRFSAVAKRW